MQFLFVHLQKKAVEEHANAVRQETLATQYNVQINELRSSLTDTCFNSTREDQTNEETNI